MMKLTHGLQLNDSNHEETQETQETARPLFLESSVETFTLEKRPVSDAICFLRAQCPATLSLFVCERRPNTWSEEGDVAGV